MNRFETEQFLESPEFERRCNQFIKDVRVILPDKFPQIIVHAHNDTDFEIEYLDREIRSLRQSSNSLDSQELHRLRQELSREQEMSSYSSMAYVGLYSRHPQEQNRETNIDIIYSAIGAIEKLASRYQAQKLYPLISWELNQDLIESEVPKARYFYEFT